jgi:diguanylate cyclase (GGDEF)-like protein
VAPERLLALLRRLQSSLELEELIHAFAEEVRGLLAVDGIRYALPQGTGVVEDGEPGRHSCVYRLTIGGEALGELSFTRESPFSEPEIAVLELLGSYLIYPLRNALLYARALQVAIEDPLTGAFNRVALEGSLERDMSLARRHGSPFSLLMLDLDHFKSINDRWGHLTGDCVLKVVVEQIRSCVRDSDPVFRYGGEEFTVLLSNTDAAGAARLAERIRRSTAELESLCEGNRVRVTLSAGVAEMAPDDTPERLLLRADRALYEAKQTGRNRVVVDQ